VYVSVENGTNAGRKRPLRDRAGDWLCSCPGRRKQRGYLVRCPDCGTARAEAIAPESVQAR
jgi:hypothetical protein